jgi:hypothetical protein
MADAETFVSEFHAKNQASLERHLLALKVSLAKESFDTVDLLRLTMKDAVESAEVAALWLVDCADLEMKIGFAEQCGAAATHLRLLTARATALGAQLFDPRFSGYSRFFGFLRSLQTPEERSAASQVTLRTFHMGRLSAFAYVCAQQGDPETARLFAETLMADEQSVFDTGWQTLIAAATTEESQARARRSAFRIVELAGDVVDPLQLRKSLPKRKPPAPVVIPGTGELPPA